MKKGGIEGFRALVVVGIVIIPLMLLYENVGLIGILTFIGFATIGIIYFKKQATIKEKAAFEKLVLYTLYNKLELDEAQSINKTVSKKSSPHSLLIRHLQILRDSIDISLSTKTRKTAISRRDLIETSLVKIQKYSYVISTEVYSEIQRVVDDFKISFNTKFYLNIAEGHLEKAEKLKTIKSKRKYIALAKDTIEEGFQNSESDKPFLSQMHKKIKRYETSMVMKN